MQVTAEECLFVAAAGNDGYMRFTTPRGAASPEAAGLREAWEEVGIPPAFVDVVGDTVYAGGEFTQPKNRGWPLPKGYGSTASRNTRLSGPACGTRAEWNRSAPGDGETNVLVRIARERVPDTCPGCPPILHELMKAVARGFFFEQPIHVH